ncbi:MAG: hypothetical protein ACXW6K_23775, partial [Candidatus Binatia bacterium]
EKSFLYPSCPLGMTGIARHLCDLAPWREIIRLSVAAVRRQANLFSQRSLGKSVYYIRDNLRGLRKFLDAPQPRGRVSNPPLRLPIFFALFAFFAAILLFGYGCAAPCLRGESSDLIPHWSALYLDSIDSTRV